MNEIILAIVSLCQIQIHDGCSARQAKYIETQQLNCFVELLGCVEQTEGTGPCETERFKTCVKVKAKYGHVRVPERFGK